jgi:predicted RNA-binding protein with TRAM domain
MKKNKTFSGNNRNTNQSQPVIEGQEYTGRVDSVGGKGDGIIRVQGFVVFVPGVKEGDYIKFKITKVLEKVSFGAFIEKVDPPKNQEKKFEQYIPPSKRKEEIPDEVKELLTTEGDSEDFGDGEDDDEEF